MAKKPSTKKTVETLMHDADKRKNIPTAEFQSVAKQEEQHTVRIAYERRNRDLDPQLVWRGKDVQGVRPSCNLFACGPGGSSFPVLSRAAGVPNLTRRFETWLSSDSRVRKQLRRIEDELNTERSAK
jgi:hypothetical protein